MHALLKSQNCWDWKRRGIKRWEGNSLFSTLVDQLTIDRTELRTQLSAVTSENENPTGATAAVIHHAGLQQDINALQTLRL